MQKRIPTLLSVAIHGEDYALKINAEPVKDPLDKHLQDLIQDMLYTCRRNGGTVLAANQVCKMIQLMVILTQDSKAPIIIINPKIIWQSSRLEVGEETCLSSPGVRGEVRRHTDVRVRYIDGNGETKENVFEDQVARAFARGWDTLNGIPLISKIVKEEMPV